MAVRIASETPAASKSDLVAANNTWRPSPYRRSLAKPFPRRANLHPHALRVKGAWNNRSHNEVVSVPVGPLDELASEGRAGDQESPGLL